MWSRAQDWSYLDFCNWESSNEQKVFKAMGRNECEQAFETGIWSCSTKHSSQGLYVGI